MAKVTFDYSKASNFIAPHEMEYMKKLANDAKELLVSKTGAGNDYVGWIDLPVDYDKEEFARIKTAAKRIQEDSDVLVVIGIGGSYLGARAAIEFLRHGFYNNLTKEERKTPEIYYVGNNISSTYIAGLIDVIGNRDFSVNIISKSGTTTEPAIAFRVFKEMLEKKYGHEEAVKRIYATTDKAKGALKNLANEEGYETFVVPDDVGGRFSVLTAVGLLPIAVSGADIDSLMAGAAEGRRLALESEFEEKFFEVFTNKEKLGGRTAIMVDVSGSMYCDDGCNRSKYASALAMIGRELCENIDVYSFSNELKVVPNRHGFALKEAIHSSQSHCGTYLWTSVKQLSNLKTMYDRLIIITDEQSMDYPCDSYIEKQYIINIATYNKEVNYDSKIVHINGMSDKVYNYILEYERD